MEKQKITQLKKRLKSRLNRPMRYYLDLCTRCGICYDSCHAFYGIPRKEYSPVHRAEVVRKIFKKHNRLSGFFLPYWGDSTRLNDQVMDEVLDAAFSCTGCRRCTVHCPFGIDTPYILGIAKVLLIENETAPEELVMLAEAAAEKGRSINEFKAGYREVIKDLEKKVQERLKLKSSEGLIPMEKKDADILFVGLAGAHSIVTPAVLFNAAQENWTLSYFEAVNFGAFLGDPEKLGFIAQRIIKEATELNVKEIVIVECGTAYRILKYLLGKLPFKISSIVEVIHRYLAEGKLKIKAGAVKDVVTYHDPCQLARNGNIFDEPREVIKQIAPKFKEMSPTREFNWCCGGGGGLVALDNEDFRIKSGKAKRDQIVESKAKVVVTACENCVTQLQTIRSGYGLDVDIKYLTEIVEENLKL